ncbi:MAG TPA: septum site-determining protein MinC [Limnochordales bacterium]
MQGKEAVVFRGYRGGVAVQVDRDAPFGDVVEALRRKLASAENFFQGGSVRIEMGDREPDEVERRVLRELFRAYGLTVVDDDAPSPRRGANGTAARPAAAGSGARGAGAAGFAGSGSSLAGLQGTLGADRGGDSIGEPCLLVRRTLRSGQRLEYDGSVVILGDVNPGAVVVCTGHVVVMGALRGVVHAGARGDTDARVIALRLEPTQLRIAHYISRPPDDQVPSPNGPEVALVQDERIQIEAYVP